MGKKEPGTESGRPGRYQRAETGSGLRPGQRWWGHTLGEGVWRPSGYRVNDCEEGKRENEVELGILEG